MLRKHGVADAYEQLKALTRGRPVDYETLRACIADAPISDADRERLLALDPPGYIGLAARLAREI